MRHRHRIAVLAASSTLTMAVLTISACAGTPQPETPAAARKPVTITFWHGWSQPHEVAAINANLARFRTLRPDITVKTVSEMDDEKIVKGIAAGNGGPDVVSSFTTDYVGQFCSTGAWVDLRPFLHASRISLKRLFPRAVMDYTQYDGKRCALPLLADAYGLYYNKDAFAKAGISDPPRTLSELKRAAIRLTKYNRDGSLKVVGFLPVLDSYEATSSHLVGLWQPSYFDGAGKSNLAREPAIRQFLHWQRDLIDALGGYQRLKKFRDALEDEWGPENGFHTGQLAMMMDGEWRLANLAQDKVGFAYGTAPFPVPDNKTDTYGGGYLAGTVIGISRNSGQQQAAWELVKYLTTDTDALVSFAEAIKNVPSTFPALQAMKKDADPNFRTFLSILANPDSNTTPSSPDGAEARNEFSVVAERWQARQVKDLTRELAAVDRGIDRVNAGR